MATDAKSKDFVISRVLNAPRALVWQAFVDAEAMKQWWGPKGLIVLVSKMDLRPGGSFHYGMQAPDGSLMWGKFAFREIVPQQRMVFISSFSDEQGGTTRHSGHLEWPLEMMTVLSFEDMPAARPGSRCGRTLITPQPKNRTPSTSITTA